MCWPCLAQIADLQRSRVGQRVFGGQVPFLHVGGLDILRIDVEGAAVLGGAAGKAFLRGARRGYGAGRGRGDRHVDAWMNGVIEVRRWLEELPSKKLVAP